MSNLKSSVIFFEGEGISTKKKTKKNKITKKVKKEVKYINFFMYSSKNIKKDYYRNNIFF